MKTAIERITIFLLVLILSIWGLYHLIRFTKHSIELETVFQETVPRSVSGRGIAIRDEQVLGKMGTGTPRFLYKDGSRIGLGQPVVEYYSGDIKNSNIQHIREIDEEIRLLEEAQNKNINNFTSAPTISRDIREQFTLLTQISTTGRSDELLDVRSELAQLINCRQIATGKNDNFSYRIEMLKQERETLRSGVNIDNIPQGNAPVSGYFAKSSDGYETKLNSKKMETFSIEKYIKLVDEDLDETDKSNTGRMVTNSKWHFAVCLPAYQTEWLNIDQKATLTVDGSIHQIPAKVSKIMVENNNETAVVILSSDIITEDILNLRIADVTISFSQFTGLRINNSAIHFRNNLDGTVDRGVYVLDNHVVYFRKIDPIYEDPNFVLSKLYYANSEESDYVQLFDQVIMGNDLYEGKIIQ